METANNSYMSLTYDSVMKWTEKQVKDWVQQELAFSEEAANLLESGKYSALLRTIRGTVCSTD
jgi:hypothetical protein